MELRVMDGMKGGEAMYNDISNNLTFVTSFFASSLPSSPPSSITDTSDST